MNEEQVRTEIAEFVELAVAGHAVDWIALAKLCGQATECGLKWMALDAIAKIGEVHAIPEGEVLRDSQLNGIVYLKVPLDHPFVECDCEHCEEERTVN